jgi:hypothetical protein
MSGLLLERGKILRGAWDLRHVLRLPRLRIAPSYKYRPATGSCQRSRRSVRPIGKAPERPIHNAWTLAAHGQSGCGVRLDHAAEKMADKARFIWAAMDGS